MEQKRNMITAAQLRAARGLMDWTRSELAKAAGLSAETIKNIEHGVYMPQESTINAIIDAFGRKDIIFTDDEGVKKKRNSVRIFSGKKGYKEMLEHIYITLKAKGGIIRQFALSDGKHLPFADEEGDLYLSRMEKIQDINAQVLTFKGDHNFPAPYCEYKWLNANIDEHIPFYVYNDYVCLIIKKDEKNFETISIHSKLLANKYKEQFSRHWEKAITPSKEVNNV